MGKKVDYDEEETTCWACHGTGEGAADGYPCMICCKKRIDNDWEGEYYYEER